MSLAGLLGRSSSRPPGAKAPESTDYTQRRNLKATWRVLLSWASLSVVALVLLSVRPSLGEATRLASGSLLLAAASASCGALLGFLFGIPRSLQQDAGAVVVNGALSPGAPVAGGTPPAQRSVVTGVRVNTNLEQISDWLTKILVGVGLTQLQFLWPNLQSVAKDVSQPIGSTAVALFVMINFSIWGFFAAYLVTRLFLATAFGVADAAAERVDRDLSDASVLASRGAFSAAAERFASVLQQLGNDATPEQRLKACEGQVYSHLYEDPPEGFSRAISVATAFINEPTNVPSGRVWAYLAAAYGQAYRYEQNRDAASAALPQLESKALDAVKRALEANPALKSLLRMLWDPSDQTKAGSQENDLEVFHSHPAFRALLE